MSDLLEELNNEQRAAVCHGDGPVLIVAGPGTGKTRTLTHRIAYLVRQRGVDPGAIVAVTFTNKAAQEMRERLLDLLDDADAARQVRVGTFHALCLGMLHEHRAPDAGPIALCDEADRMAIVRRLLRQTGASGKPRNTATAISRAKNLYRPDNKPELFDAYNQALAELGLTDLDDVLMQTVELLDTRDDVLASYRGQWRYLCVDEYQDTSPIQCRLVELLSGHGSGLFAIGDPNQSIYAFRGASAQSFARFEQTFAGTTVIHLTQNYRSTQTILDACRQIIARGDESDSPRLVARTVGGLRVEVHACASEKAEALLVVRTVDRLLGGTTFHSMDSGRVASEAEPEVGGFDDIAVLYRLHAQADLLEEAFVRAGLPYQKIGGTRLLDHAGVRQTVAWLRLCTNTRDDTSLRRVLDLPSVGISQPMRRALYECQADRPCRLYETVSALAADDAFDAPERDSLVALCKHVTELQELAATESAGTVVRRAVTLADAWPGWERSEPTTPIGTLLALADQHDGALHELLERLALQADADVYDPRAEKVSLMTLHAAKGLEFPVVFIVGCEQGLIPYTGARDLAPDELDEERRLFYVGMSRAGRQLILTHARTRLLYGQRDTRRVSPLLTQISSELKSVHQVTPKAKRKKKEEEPGQKRLF